jgi:SAM-dependent methyltransferase
MDPIESSRPRNSSQIATYFDRFAGTYGDGAYYQGRRQAVLEALAPEIAQARDILDVGCGNGAYLTKFVEIPGNRTVAGIDLSFEMLLSARIRTAAKCRLARANVAHLPFKPGCRPSTPTCVAAPPTITTLGKPRCPTWCPTSRAGAKLILGSMRPAPTATPGITSSRRSARATVRSRPTCRAWPLRRRRGLHGRFRTTPTSSIAFADALKIDSAVFWAVRWVVRSRWISPRAIPRASRASSSVARRPSSTSARRIEQWRAVTMGRAVSPSPTTAIRPRPSPRKSAR